jgi:hypothetical protein
MWTIFVNECIFTTPYHNTVDGIYLQTSQYLSKMVTKYCKNLGINVVDTVFPLTLKTHTRYGISIYSHFLWQLKNNTNLAMAASIGWKLKSRYSPVHSNPNLSGFIDGNYVLLWFKRMHVNDIVKQYQHRVIACTYREYDCYWHIPLLLCQTINLSLCVPTVLHDSLHRDCPFGTGYYRTYWQGGAGKVRKVLPIYAPKAPPPLSVNIYFRRLRSTKPIL